MVSVSVDEVVISPIAHETNVEATITSENAETEVDYDDEPETEEQRLSDDSDDSGNESSGTFSEVNEGEDMDHDSMAAEIEQAMMQNSTENIEAIEAAENEHTQTDVDVNNLDPSHNSYSTLDCKPELEESDIASAPRESSDEECDDIKGHLQALFSPSLKEKFSGKTMKQVFPHYRKNKRLRFHRLFGIGSKYDVPGRYAHLKKKKANEESNESPARKWFFQISVKPEEIQDDYNDFLTTPYYVSSRNPTEESKTASPTKENQLGKIESSEALKLKGGPANMWYEMYCMNSLSSDDSKTWFGIPKEEVAEDDDTVVRVKERISNAIKGNISEDEARSFFMVNHMKWEQTVMWELDESLNPEKLNQKSEIICAWIPSPTARSLSAYLKAKGLDHRIPDEALLADANPKKRKTVGSFFSPQNYDLLHGIWEESICWDKKCKELENPTEFMLDPADENLLPILNDDRKRLRGLTTSPGKSGSPDKSQSESPDKKQQLRRSKILLGKLENSNLRESKDIGTEKDANSNSQFRLQGLKRHKFNLSSDSFYRSKQEKEAAKGLGSLIHHATTAVQISQPFFPTYLSVQRLRHFHRWPLKRYSYGLLSEPGLKPVKFLTEYIELIRQEREAERQASGGGDMFYMRTADDLSGRDGDLVLAEISEQHPPLISQIGMSSKIRHYYKKGNRSDQGPPNYSYGEVVYMNESPFLGNLQNGATLSVLENSMYRAPIYNHEMKSNDFLIIRCRDAYYIRKVPMIFTVGQQYPLIEVPSPNSKKASHFQRDFLAVFVYRLFWSSKEKQKRIKMEDIRAAFGPHYSESSIRKRLKICSDFKRAGHEQNWWNLKSGFRLPNEEELRRLVSPEECCAFYSMQAAEQRLRDAGYGDKAFTLDDQLDDPNASDEKNVEDEVKCAPWNTTRAYLSAIQGKFMLDITGIGDPTGCGEGFSFVRLPGRINKDEESVAGNEKKRNVTGTDADLRKLNLTQARQILVKHKIPDEEIQKLSRWEIIDVIRTLSTEKAKTGSGESMYDKFARIGKYGISDSHEKFREECQRIFDQQNKVLASDEVLSSDDASSSEDDEEDLESMAKNVESLMAKNKSCAELAREKEENERKELQKMILSGNNPKEEPDKGDKNKKDPTTNIADDVDMSKYNGKVLKIYRNFRDDETGEEYQRVETVRKPDVIHVYMSIRDTKDEAWMSEFVDFQQIRKEEERKKRRRLQDQLRRLERNKQKGKFGATSKAKKHDPQSFKVTCGACGLKGHMKTNSLCPYFGKTPPAARENLPRNSSNFDLSSEVTNDDEGEDLIKVEDTKITLGKGLFDNVDKRHQGSSSVHGGTGSKKDEESSIVYRKHYTSGGMLRKRADPVVVISSMFEKLIQELKQVPGSEVFHHKVREKDVPDYYSIVSQPMDLQKMRDKCMKKQYKTRNDFLEDINLIVCNSITYNGLNHSITENAHKISDMAQTHFRSLESKYSKLEKRINPLLDDNDQVGFSFLLREIANKLKQIPESSPFHVPVSKKAAPHYRSLVKYPMDLDTLLKNCVRHSYRTKEAFMNDISLIASNSELFNGPEHILTSKATEIVNMARIEISLHDEYLTKLERRIWEASQKSTGSVASSMSPTGFSELSGFSEKANEAGRSSSESDSDTEEPTTSKRSRAMITNLDHYFSSFDNVSERKPNASDLHTQVPNKNTLATIHETSNFAIQNEENFDPSFQMKAEVQFSADDYSQLSYQNEQSYLSSQDPAFHDQNSSSYPMDDSFNSNSNQYDFGSQGNPAENSNSQVIWMNEDSQDPETMAKILLGDISESDSEKVEGSITDNEEDDEN